MLLCKVPLLVLCTLCCVHALGRRGGTVTSAGEFQMASGNRAGNSEDEELEDADDATSESSTMALDSSAGFHEVKPIQELSDLKPVKIGEPMQLAQSSDAGTIQLAQSSDAGHPIGAGALPDTFTGIFDDTLCNTDSGRDIVNVWCQQWQRVVQKINVIFGSGRAQVSAGFMGRKCRVNKNPINLNDAALSKVDKNTVVSGNGQSVALTQNSGSGCIPVCSDVMVADHVEESKSKVYAGFGSPDSRHSKGGVLCYKACKITLPSQTVQIVDRVKFKNLKDFLRDHKALTPDIEKHVSQSHYPDFVYEATFVAVKEVRCINPLSHSSKVRQPILDNGKSLDASVHGMDTRDNWSVRNECGRMGHSAAGQGACPKDCKVPHGAPSWFKGCVGGSEFRGLLQKQISHGGSLICKVYKSCKLEKAKLTHLKSRANCPTCKQYVLKAGHTINVPTILANGHKAGCANF